MQELPLLRQLHELHLHYAGMLLAIGITIPLSCLTIAIWIIELDGNERAEFSIYVGVFCGIVVVLAIAMYGQFIALRAKLKRLGVWERCLALGRLLCAPPPRAYHVVVLSVIVADSLFASLSIGLVIASITAAMSLPLDRDSVLVYQFLSAMCSVVVVLILLVVAGLQRRELTLRDLALKLDQLQTPAWCKAQPGHPGAVAPWGTTPEVATLLSEIDTRLSEVPSVRPKPRASEPLPRYALWFLPLYLIPHSGHLLFHLVVNVLRDYQNRTKSALPGHTWVPAAVPQRGLAGFLGVQVDKQPDRRYIVPPHQVALLVLVYILGRLFGLCLICAILAGLAGAVFKLAAWYNDLARHLYLISVGLYFVWIGWRIFAYTERVGWVLVAGYKVQHHAYAPQTVLLRQIRGSIGLAACLLTGASALSVVLRDSHIFAIATTAWVDLTTMLSIGVLIAAVAWTPLIVASRNRE